ncbi:helix-turn-helix domain-containing protein [Hymenobacter arizonensis]|uniref:Helix-turn-helix domain-containing protein n=1 Tax=Hymenobacter arizonensis TaxID=1227077 RepID=A0A1I6BDL9_HYMAR|nr:helix-turn-helix domain-containing protein [Hymenobacter arizonensis]SFQ78994.1 Helix-turn-helix domain-containing protein [Hymenobacter arizonensis]
MLPSHFAPHPALLDYVDSVFVLTCDFAATGLSPLYPFVPTHNRFLCFYLDDPVKVQKPAGAFVARARALIVGPHLAPVTLDLGRHHRAVVVNLKPAGMYRLLGIPMAELLDRDYDARLVVGREIDELLDRLHAGRTPAACNAVMQRYLLGKRGQLRPALPFDRALLHQVRASGNLPVERVAAHACLSVRQFERRAHERLGLPPKLFSRLIRFSHAYKHKEGAPQTPWLDIAHRCGYFDQMHFIRDFKFFAGFPPGRLQAADLEQSVLFRTMEDLTILL